MCLRVKSQQEVAQEDITVYKHLRCYGDEYYTPYMDARVPEDGVLIPYGNPNNKDIPTYGWSYLTVEEGAIHAYTDAKEAICASRCGGLSPSIMFEATIPKGTKFIIGEFNSIASTKLVINFNKVIHTN